MDPASGEFERADVLIEDDEIAAVAATWEPTPG